MSLKVKQSARGIAYHAHKWLYGTKNIFAVVGVMPIGDRWLVTWRAIIVVTKLLRDRRGGEFDSIGSNGHL